MSHLFKEGEKNYINLYENWNFSSSFENTRSILYETIQNPWRFHFHFHTNDHRHEENILKSNLKNKELKIFFLLISELIFKLPTDKLVNPLNLPYWSILEEKSVNYLLREYKEYNWKRQEKISIFIFNNNFFAEKTSTVFGNWSLLILRHRWPKSFLFYLLKLGVDFLWQFFRFFKKRR